MTPERRNFIYSFPCLNDENIKKFEPLLLQGKAPSREEQDKLFPDACRRKEKLATRMNRNLWDSEVINAYWFEEHNRIINNKEEGYGHKNYPSNTLREHCKVHFVRVLSVEKKFATVKYNTIEKKVINYLPDLKSGDLVTIHKGYAIEKISQKMHEKYAKKD